MKVDLASELSRPIWGITTSPWQGYERNAGYGVMDVPFASGDVLALRVFPGTDFGGYASVWHRDPAGNWSQYVDRAPVEAGCPRVWGPALSVAAPASIGLSWTGPNQLQVTLDEPDLVWHLEFEGSPVLAALNAVQARLPLWTWKPRPLLVVRERVARLLGLGPVRMSGPAPSGERLVAVMRRMYWVSTSSARLGGRDLGRAVVLNDCPTIAGWPLPRRGVLAIGEAHATRGDIDAYEGLRRRSLGDAEPGVTRDGLTKLIEQLSERFLHLLPRDAELATPVSVSSTWTVRDVVAHMATVVPRYAEGPRGGGDWVDDPTDLPGLNEHLLRELGPVPIDDLVERIRADVRALGEQIHGYKGDPPTYRFNGGQLVRADHALGILAGEFLVHGHDVAEALGREWPMTAWDVEAVLRGVEQVLPGFVDTDNAGEHSATYELRVRGGAVHRWRFQDGDLDCRTSVDAPVDCHIRGEAAALLLVMYGRLPAWRAALTGKVVAWGWRPWLALSLPDRFHNP